MDNRSGENSDLERSLFFRAEHFIPLVGVGRMERDMKIQNEIDTAEAGCEHIHRLENITLYESAVVVYNAVLFTGVGVAAIYAISKLS